MSTSSLTSLPPPSSDTLDIPAPRPAPKRTYGRARPASPPPLAETSSSSSIVSAQPAYTSPSKALLDRWSSVNQSWRQELSKLDAPSSDNTEEVDDLEEARKEMERLRRQARGLKALDTNQQTTPRPPYTNLAPPKGTTPLAQTSSLTSLPDTATSPQRSSPPIAPARALQAQSSDTAEETMFPIRKSGANAKPKRIILSDEESGNDEDDPPLFAKDTSRSATPDQVYEGEASTTERGSSPPPSRSIARSADESDEEDNENMAEYLRKDEEARVQKETQARALAEAEAVRHPQSSALDGLDDLFDNEEDDEPREKKSRASRGLNKADKAEMEKDIARAHRERPVAFSRPEPSRLPITAWLAQANVAVRTKIENKSDVPGLTFGRSPATSPSQQTPPDDEIISWTPSSGHRRELGTTSTSRISIENPNTPTPIARRDKGKGKANILDDEGEEGQDLMRFLDEEKKRDDREARRKKLEEFKRQAIAARQQQQKPMKLNMEPAKPSSDGPPEEEEESDFEIDNEPTPKKDVFVQKALNGRQVPGAKAILSKSNNQSTISKQKQGFLARAGKLHKNKNHTEGISETYVDFAGKAFSHSNQKLQNGGARPSTQKKGRDEALSNEEFNKFIVAKHQQQISLIARKKEEDYGRVKMLPGRQEQIIQIPETQVEGDQPEDADGDKVEDEDDEEYNPEEGEEEEEERMVWSGEDEGSGSEAEPDEEAVDQGEEGIENIVDVIPETLEDDEEEEEEVNPMFKRKPRASARVAFDSDDEDNAKPSSAKEVPRQEDQPQSSATLKSSTADDGFGGFDLGGFGDASQGFSQLFGATQAADPMADGDAFAGLRADHQGGFLPSQAILPEVQISKTQVERDNNLIAAEIEEAAMERMQEMEQPKKQYINERGLFTQTKPPTAVYEDTQISSARRNLGGLSDVSMFDGQTQTQTQQTPYGKQTQTPTQMGTSSIDRHAIVGSPTQTQEEDEEEETFSRLRRRVSDPDVEGNSIMLSPTQPAQPAQPQSQNRTVFDRMMKAASRPQKPKLKSRMVDEQAEESDEDNGWAMPFGAAENEDDDDDDEQDTFLEGLVDDQHVDEEERRRQDELANQKNREIQEADDFRLEQEARKITEGQYRTKKRGKDFVDDESGSDDELGGKRKRWSKKERKKRRLDREDGLDKLEGEANVFKRVYEVDLESDEDDIDETPFFDMDNMPRGGGGWSFMTMTREPGETLQEEVDIAPRLTAREKADMLRARARMNEGKTVEDLAMDDMDEDALILPNDPRARALKQRRNTYIDVDDEEDEEQSRRAGDGNTGYSISKRSSAKISATLTGGTDIHRRSLASYASYVQEESQVTRRAAGGAAGVSVIRPQAQAQSASNNPLSRNGSLSAHRPAPVPHPHRQSTTSSTNSGSGSVLLSKSGKFN
ncbi:uncharacterized protein I303_103154 [Kwoniella dejecticola CBS 10117]|uniref:DNA replication checkpoint mediator MRC1 domain-containing protein n=1 Tax=Kwoniella dejecticola CBS 10117 TaxID=1296121 RepID=A0A1A6AAR3_9TREE|nr:uncharacterized protein I303_03175 [Kwoniella dejecticola CBS 10117]OBR87151.1 hypothetical protein I303_03175 [Kwoniella dejecticola CBS 10117]